VDTQKEYSKLEKTWTGAKKNVIDSSKELGKSTELIRSYEKDLSQLSKKINKVIADYDASLSSVTVEIGQLEASAQAKYEKAASASETGAKLSTMQSLYKSAEADASLLDQDKKLLVGLKEALMKETMSQKIDGLLDNVDSVVKKSDSLQIELGNVLAELSAALLDNVNACHYGGPTCVAKDQNSLANFKTGVAKLEKIQREMAEVKREFNDDVKQIKAIEMALAKSEKRIMDLNAQIKKWETDSKMKLRAGSQLVRVTSDGLDSAFRVSKNSLKQFSQVRERLNGGKDAEKEKRTKLAMQDTLKQMVASENLAKGTEKLLTQARKQGEKEAQKYGVLAQQAREKAAKLASTSKSSTPKAAKPAAPAKAPEMDTRTASAPSKPPANAAKNKKLELAAAAINNKDTPAGTSAVASAEKGAAAVTSPAASASASSSGWFSISSTPGGK
jgi:predicted component of type VI protein secretion system